jgi:hypothetical protein
MKRILLSASVILLSVACVQVPMTTIQVPTEHGIVTIKAPKDSKMSGLKANFEKGTVTLDSYEARMNPDVIGASAAGQAELIKAYGDLANNMAQMGMRMFAASHGIPLSAPASPAPAPQAGQTITQEQLNAIIERRAQQIAASNAAQSTNVPPAAVRSPRNRTPPPATVSTNTPPQ